MILKNAVPVVLHFLWVLLIIVSVINSVFQYFTKLMDLPVRQTGTL